MHEINITPRVPYEEVSMAGDNHTYMAGDNHTLTCTVNSELPANLKWVRIINGEQFEVVNTSTITVSAHNVSDEITQKWITFKPLLTSHGGKYACVSVLYNISRRVQSTKELEYVVNIKSRCFMACITYTIMHTKLT